MQQYTKFMQRLATGQPITLHNPAPGEIAFRVGAQLFIVGMDRPLVITQVVPRRVLHTATELHDRLRAGMLQVG